MNVKSWQLDSEKKQGLTFWEIKISSNGHTETGENDKLEVEHDIRKSLGLVYG